MNNIKVRCSHKLWLICTACQGRIHTEECTSRKQKELDCCPERHKMLHDAGEIYGRDDNSAQMVEF